MLQFADLRIELNPNSKPDLPSDPSKLLFGHKFTDHMFTVKWTQAGGWEKPQIGPFKHLQVHPAAKVLHYSIELFEGMKAYRGVDGKIRLFRPNLNLMRMHKSKYIVYLIVEVTLSFSTLFLFLFSNNQGTVRSALPVCTRFILLYLFGCRYMSSICILNGFSSLDNSSNSTRTR